jgi:serpin B
MIMSLSRRKFLSLSGAAMAVAATGRFARGCPPLEEQPKSLAMGNNQFAADLYGKLRETKGNLFFSPFSISTALAMSSAGARGNTLAEMTKALYLPTNPHEAFGNLHDRVFAHHQDIKRPFELTAANALWSHQGQPWRDEFKAILGKHYQASVIETDFVKSEAARNAINAWVEKETRDKIKDLLPAGVITPLTRAVIANAVYFKADWKTQFKKELTKDRPFHIDSGEPVDVPMMEQTGEFEYGETELDPESRLADSVQVVEMPYVGGSLSMVMLMPKTHGLNRLESRLTEANLTEWTKDLHKQSVRVRMPRFKFEPAGSMKLNEPLKELGMVDAFDDLKADFTGMHSAKDVLYITAVMHKAFVDVNEEGTEAAAATGVVFGLRSAVKETTFIADRPFLFLIRDVKSGTILFMGRVSNPKG